MLNVKEISAIVTLAIISFLLFIAFDTFRVRLEPNLSKFSPKFATDPTVDRILWMDDEEWPPKIIVIYQGEKTIKYLPVAEPNESKDN